MEGRCCRSLLPQRTFSVVKECGNVDKYCEERLAGKWSRLGVDDAVFKKVFEVKCSDVRDKIRAKV